MAAFGEVSLRFLMLFLLSATFSAESDQCRNESCHPPTGNLLIGRKHKLHASSTCGIHRPQRFCFASPENVKCFLCDSRRMAKGNNDHRIENVVSEGNRKWWQSENGVENVSVRLDLDAEFLFSKLRIVFGPSPNPAAFLIERSTNFGISWSVFRYFAFDCAVSFPNVPEGPPKKPREAICSQGDSATANATGKTFVFDLRSQHLAVPNLDSSKMQQLSKITNLRINFTKLHTLGNDTLGISQEIDEKYWYSMSELAVQGTCLCHGHARRCVPIDAKMSDATNPAGIVHDICECQHNTKGLNCDQCQDLFNDLPWRPGTGEQPNECVQCECNGHATRCHFDWSVFNATAFGSGGVCDDCRHNTRGRNCHKCKAHFYKQSHLSMRDPNVCRPCQCDKRGTQNGGPCAAEDDTARQLVAGQCPCKENVQGQNCDRCKDGFCDLSEDNPKGCEKCD